MSFFSSTAVHQAPPLPLSFSHFLPFLLANLPIACTQVEARYVRCGSPPLCDLQGPWTQEVVLVFPRCQSPQAPGEDGLSRPGGQGPLTFTPGFRADRPGVGRGGPEAAGGRRQCESHDTRRRTRPLTNEPHTRTQIEHAWLQYELYSAQKSITIFYSLFVWLEYS